MRRWAQAVPKASWWKTFTFWIGATYWYLFIRPPEKRWQEIEEAKHGKQ